MEFKNRHGQVSLAVHDNIVIAKFKGSLNSQLLSIFTHELLKATEQLKGQPWGYISDSSDTIASTPEAEQDMVKISQTIRARNCAVTAFILTSAIAITQLQRIMNNAGQGEHFKDCLFNDIDTAKHSVARHLKNTQAD